MAKTRRITAVFIITVSIMINCSPVFAPFSYAENDTENSFYAAALAGGSVSGTGSFELNENSRFYIVTETDSEADKEMIETAGLAASLFALSGIPSDEKLDVIYGDGRNTRPGDIILEAAGEGGLQDYSLSVTDRAVISSCGQDGIYYGLLALLETFIESDGDNLITSFSIKDSPDLAERAVFLDCGRKYFEPDWIKAFIRRSSVQRYNTLILHFSEAEGLRLDSRVFPWLTEDIESLSMAEMADIVRYANSYHMKVIPSFDVPGHNRYIVTKYAEYAALHPDFSFDYRGMTYGPHSEGFGSIANHYSHNGYTFESDYIGIDITSSYAVAFMDALIDDYAAFFRELGCTDFDMGGDEVIGYSSMYIGGDLMIHENRWDFLEHWNDYAVNVLKITDGSANDVLINYLNRIDLRLKMSGYTCRVFNDEIDLKKEQHLKLRPSVKIAYWNASARSAEHYAGEGYRLLNCVSKWCYYAVGTSGGIDIMRGKYSTVNGRNIYDNWDPMSYSSRAYKYRPVPDKNRAGGYFCIWCDNPYFKSDEMIWNETEALTWANSTKMWNASLGNNVPEENADSYTKIFSYSYEELEAFVRMMDMSGVCSDAI